ncbi:MAG TPA: LacI family DNA-binding transcriptional regulator [Candidatus Scybalocola faecigallinarum]|uniref:LacI family DNA-binding transcriptional regulator n=1 Tax=Candidatus Scybalocola faecigallinarum TaxID=2840941 RepID=A0A9D1F213_9FIRM|nr:LacI family DNA-binding transcriptional regulator [Candidatus Scybalocola faecigallinarum]
MSITAKELAKKLNLSPAAVSMALNHKPGVSTTTRRLVFDAAEKYGYDFSRITEKHPVPGSIYLVIYKKHGAVVTDTPFFSQISEGISLECKRQEYNLKVNYIYEDDDVIQRQLEDMRSSDCCGMILLGTEMTDRDLRPFLKLPSPVVLLDTYFESAACDSVLINNVQGAYMATSYLIQKCSSQPGYLRSAYEIYNFTQRSAGFYKAIRAAGMSASQSIVHDLTPSVDGAFADMLEIIKSGEPLASCYFADNDLIAVGAVKALKQHGLRIPEDVAIVGFDNQPISSVIEPNLTTVHVPKKYMGETAAARLISLIHDPSQPPVKTEISTSLVKRNSVPRAKHGGI